MSTHLIRNYLKNCCSVFFREAGLGEGEMITTHLSNGLMIPPKFYLSRRKIVLPTGMSAIPKMESTVCGVFIIEMEIIVPRGDLLTHMNQV